MVSTFKSCSQIKSLKCYTVHQNAKRVSECDRKYDTVTVCVAAVFHNRLESVKYQSTKCLKEPSHSGANFWHKTS